MRRTKVDGVQSDLLPKMRRPTAQELKDAVGGTTSDVIAPNLKVLFCGINPSVYSVVVGHHFARPGNRFWPALYASGFTPRRLMPQEEGELLKASLGITNVAARATVAAADLDLEELAEGGRLLEAKVKEFAPRWLAVLGISAYRVAFRDHKATIGPQLQTLGETRVWVLPNPSGLNAHYHPPDLARLFREFRLEVEADED